MRPDAKSFSTMMLVLTFAAGTEAVFAESYEYLFNRDAVKNDHEMFLNLAVGDYGYDRAALEPLLPKIKHVESDLPVILFVSRESGRPLEAIVNQRALGLSWSSILKRHNVPTDVLFAGIDRDPGPPYGRAWGYWKKHPSTTALSDSDVRGLVQVRLGSRWARMTPYQMARGQGRGESVVTVVADRKGRPFEVEKVEPSTPVGKSHGRGR
ncbi:MAG TPA: hypothetical protein VFW45_08455 [Candidatus Polarisedimenticolia bacterium]|nr:hypothetical protein [Candidatus Polarisedimenticolia bacterium]